MICSIDPTRAPLARYNSLHLKNIKFRELAANLRGRGVELVGGDAHTVTLNLRNLIPVNGTIQNAQRELMQVLRELGVDAVSLEPSDVIYLAGQDIFTHTVARGLESGVQGVQRLLTDIPLSEDGDGDEVVPIISRLDQAAIFAATDRADDATHEYLRGHAEIDLQNQGLLDRNDDYAGWLEPRVDTPPQLPADFQTQPKPYKSIFDRSNS